MGLYSGSAQDFAYLVVAYTDSLGKTAGAPMSSVFWFFVTRDINHFVFYIFTNRRYSRLTGFIGCIWFNTARLYRGSKFKNICKIGIKADTLKKNPIQRQPLFCYNKKYTKAEKGLIPQGSALR
jgi:hypothetical protein